MIDPRHPIRALVFDTSVLVNFLVIDRLDLLATAADHRWVTDHVLGEVTADYPVQLARYQRALESGLLEATDVTGLCELSAFAQLLEGRVLGVGECSAIALAGCRQLALALDDKRARARARATFPEVSILGTQEVMLRAIACGAITVEEADSIKVNWEINHRFRLRFGSFGELWPRGQTPS